MDLTHLILGVFMFIGGFLIGSSFAYLKAYIHFHEKKENPND